MTFNFGKLLKINKKIAMELDSIAKMFSGNPNTFWSTGNL